MSREIKDEQNHRYEAVDGSNGWKFALKIILPIVLLLGIPGLVAYGQLIERVDNIAASVRRVAEDNETLRERVRELELEDARRNGLQGRGQ